MCAPKLGEGEAHWTVSRNFPYCNDSTHSNQLCPSIRPHSLKVFFIIYFGTMPHRIRVLLLCPLQMRQKTEGGRERMGKSLPSLPDGERYRLVHYKRCHIERNKNKNVYSFNVIRLTKILLSKLKPHTRKHAKQKLNQSQRYETKKNANFSPHAKWVLVVITGCLFQYTINIHVLSRIFCSGPFFMLRVNEFHSKHWTHRTLRCTGYGEKGIKCHTK